MLIRLWGTAKLPFQSTGTRLVGVKSLSEKPRLEALEKALQPRRVQDVRFDPGRELVGLTGEAAGSIQMDSTATLKRAKFSRNTIVYRDMRLDREDEGPLACALN